MTGNDSGTTSVVGIDLAAGRGTTEVACLSLASVDSMPVFDTARHAPARSDQEIVEAVASCQPAVVAIDAPLSLPAQVMRSLAVLGPYGSEHAHTLALMPVQHATDTQVSLSQNIYLRAAERDPIWARLGVRPFPVSFLGGLSFRAIALLPALRAALPHTSIIEVFPGGSARALGLRSPHTSATSHPKRSAKTAPHMRVALQRAISSSIAGVPVVREDEAEPLSADLLDAMVAALTALAYLRRAFIAVGDPSEGQIVLPKPS